MVAAIEASAAYGMVVPSGSTTAPSRVFNSRRAIPLFLDAASFSGSRATAPAMRRLRKPWGAVVAQRVRAGLLVSISAKGPAACDWGRPDQECASRDCSDAAHITLPSAGSPLF